RAQSRRTRTRSEPHSANRFADLRPLDSEPPLPWKFRLKSDLNMALACDFVPPYSEEITPSVLPVNFPYAALLTQSYGPRRWFGLDRAASMSPEAAIRVLPDSTQD